MSLIKVKDIGFGLKGNTLDLIIAIPKDRYLDKFRVYTQKDITTGKDYSDLGIDYIHNLVQTGLSYKESFHKIFGKRPIMQCTDELTQEEYDVYSLVNGEYSIKVSQEDMTIISMKLFDEPTDESCCDVNITVPLYNIIPMKLKALEFAKTIKDNCEIPRIFMDKLLQIKAIELALCCGDYCEAAKCWGVFYDSKDSTTFKKCGCHG